MRLSCHTDKMASYQETSMYDYGVTCEDCHMPFASKSAVALGAHEGAVQTHIYYINTDPSASMFTEDGLFVALDDDGKAAVTLDFGCQRSHETASLDELAKFAKDFHDTEATLENVGLTAGLTGTWWNSERSGEGFLLQFGDAGGALTVRFLLHLRSERQSGLAGGAEYVELDGITANVKVYITSGRKWGDDFDPNSGQTVEWGTGTFTFEDCDSGNMSLTPNATSQAAGFTNLSYDLTRDDFPVASGVGCPNVGTRALWVNEVIIS